jgi:hypothetical protein
MKIFRRKIKASMELKNDYNSCFLAESKLNELFCESTVTKLLEEHGSKLTTHTDISKLSAFICKRAKRVFAILVWAEREHLIEEFYNNNFTDEWLPVRVKSPDDEYYEVESLDQKCTNQEAVRATFSTWTDGDIDNFCDNYQWPFLAPVFHEKQFRYRFHEKSRMPFLDRGDQKKTNFSFVEESTMHSDHLQIQANSTIVRYFLCLSSHR